MLVCFFVLLDLLCRIKNHLLVARRSLPEERAALEEQLPSNSQDVELTLLSIDASICETTHCRYVF